MMTLVPAEKRAPRGRESLEVVESSTYRETRHTASLRGTCNMVMYPELPLDTSPCCVCWVDRDSRKYWICWKRVGCGQLGDLLYTLVPTLHQFLARLSDKICNTRRTHKTTALSKNSISSRSKCRRQCEIKRTQKDNCVCNCCPNCAPLGTTAMIFHLFMTQKQGGTECQPLIIASYD